MTGVCGCVSHVESHVGIGGIRGVEAVVICLWLLFLLTGVEPVAAASHSR